MAMDLVPGKAPSEIAGPRLKWHCRPAIAKPVRYAQRLMGMSPREIVHRLAMHGCTRRPFVLAKWTPPDRWELCGRLDRCFLFGPEHGRRILEAWRQARPEQASKLIDLACAGLEGWDIFGVPVALDPARIPWGCRDTRFVWEINRHQFLFTLARAFWLTGDRRYAVRVFTLVEDWLNKNPCPEGVNWSSALEVGIRAVSWLWAVALLLDCDFLEETLLRRWLGSLGEHYQYLVSHLSLYADPTNHLIGEAAALWMLSVVFPDLPGAKRQQRRAIQILSEQIERQVTCDGVGAEQSTAYQKFIADFYGQADAIARRTGQALPPVVRQRMAAMSDFLAALADAAGDPARIGDGDDGRGMPLPELSKRGEGFDDRDAAVWIEGPAALQAPQQKHSAIRSRVFLEGGYCLWQADEAGDRIALLFDFGPLGLWPNASHGHADALNVQIQLRGRWILADPGTGVYEVNRRVRDSLRGTAAHNTVTVDHLDQTAALDTFKWLRPCSARLLDTFSGTEYDFAAAMHEGYRRLREPVTHYRAVLFLRPPAHRSCWIVIDRLEGAGRHHCALRFHFPPGVAIRGEGSQVVSAIDPEIQAGLRFCFSEPGWGVEKGIWSRRFGQWETSPVICLERSADLPLCWFTFISPIAEAVSVGEAADIPQAWRHGNRVCCRRGEETVEWSIKPPAPRFRFQPAGGLACFER